MRVFGRGPAVYLLNWLFSEVLKPRDQRGQRDHAKTAYWAKQHFQSLDAFAAPAQASLVVSDGGAKQDAQHHVCSSGDHQC